MVVVEELQDQVEHYIYHNIGKDKEKSDGVVNVGSAANGHSVYKYQYQYIVKKITIIYYYSKFQ